MRSGSANPSSPFPGKQDSLTSDYFDAAENEHQSSSAADVDLGIAADLQERTLFASEEGSGMGEDDDDDEEQDDDEAAALAAQDSANGSASGVASSSSVNEGTSQSRSRKGSAIRRWSKRNLLSLRSPALSHRAQSNLDLPSVSLDGADTGGAISDIQEPPCLASHQAAARSLAAPLPNLFRVTFQQAAREAAGESWLQQRIQAFDTGGRKQRKQVLEEFLEYIGHSSASGMEELFANQAHLFFIRLTSWFSVTLPMFFELPLQLKVFLTFLEYREQAFIRAFFESGTVVPLMHTLSVDFDVSDEVRCLALMVLHKLSETGRQHKELLCSRGLLSNILECVSDGLRWETLKFAGRLLCELFRSNPKYQNQVLDTLLAFLGQRLPLTQRVGTQAFISLLGGDGVAPPPSLSEPTRRAALVQRTLMLLDSPDMRVGADAYCLLCRLLRAFDCDELFLDFARRQLRTERDSVAEWIRMELEAPTKDGRAPGSADGTQGDVVKGRHAGALAVYQGRVADELAKQGVDGGRGDDLLKKLNNTNEAFCSGFRREAGWILKWGLLLFLGKRSRQLCEEMVEGGLTEALLMCLLDASRPVRQGAALAELHRLGLLSPKAKQITSEVLVKAALIEAMSVDVFMRLASPEDLSEARRRLRSLQPQSKGGGRTIGAREHQLHQHLLNRDVVSMLGESASAGVFSLTSAGVAAAAAGGAGAAAGEASLKDASKEVEVPRSGKDLYPVKRVPVQGSADAYKVDRGPMEEIPFYGDLASFLRDPLDLAADEDSPLIQELRSIEMRVGFGWKGSSHAPQPASGRRSSTASSGRRRRRSAQEVEEKKSHRPSAQHCRALVLRDLPLQGVERRTTSQLLPAAARQALLPPRPAGSRMSPAALAGVDGMSTVSDADSRAATEISLVLAGTGDPLGSQDSLKSLAWKASCSHLHTGSCHSVAMCGASCSLHDYSLAETSVGLGDGLHDFSRDEFSREQPSQDLYTGTAGGPSVDRYSDGLLAGGASVMTAGLDSLDSMAGLPSMPSSEVLSHQKTRLSAQVTERSAIAATIELKCGDRDRARAAVEDAAAAAVAAASVAAMDGATVEDRAIAAAARTAVEEAAALEESFAQARCQKRVLQISQAPFHDCVAFDRSEYEKDRDMSGKEIAWMMHPDTKLRFQALNKAGGFPKQRLAAHSGPTAASRPFIAAAAVAPMSARFHPAYSGLQAQGSRFGPLWKKDIGRADSECSGGKQGPVACATPSSARGSSRFGGGGFGGGAFGGGGGPSSVGGAAVSAPGSSRVSPLPFLPPNGRAGAEQTVRDFFPASARIVL